jgi:hypothetical protein
MPNGEPMTIDELKTQLATDCPFWGENEWAAFLSADSDTQQALASAMHLSAQGPGVDGWTVALTILEDAAPALSVIPTVGPFIAGGIQALQAIIGLV